MTNENKRKNKNKLKPGKILGFLLFAADWLYNKIGVSLAAFIFTAYEPCQKYYEGSMFYRVFQGYEPSPVKNIVKKIKKSFILKCEDSIIINGIKKCADALLSAYLGTFGAFFIALGFYCSLMYFLKVYILGKPETMLIDLIAGAALAAVSALMLVFGKQPLYEAIRGSAICGVVLFKFLGFPEKQSKNLNYDVKKVNIICFCAGMLLGAATYFIETPVGALAPICGVAAAAAALYAVLCYPEAGFLALLFIVPFLPPGNLVITGAAPCILVSVCYFLKLARGKRTFSFGIFDLFVLMFCVLIFSSGIASVSKTGSFRPAMLYLCFALIYFTGVNIIRTKEMIARAVSAVIFSGFLVAVYGVAQNYFGLSDAIWQDAEMFSGISGRVVSTLENPNVLASYLLLVIPFVIAALFSAETLRKRAPFIICAAFTVMCLVYTWSRGSWLGFIFACLILFAVINKKAMVVYLGVAALIPFAPAVLPETVIERFTSIGNVMDSSTSYRVSIWQGTLGMIKDYLLWGIGVGRAPFGLVYPAYSLAGIESAPHSHSLYLQVCAEMGIAGFIVLILVLFFFLQLCFTAIKKAGEPRLRLYAAAGMCAAAGFMLNGFTDYVWYNYRVYLMFWLIISIVAAICRFSLDNRAQNGEADIL